MYRHWRPTGPPGREVRRENLDQGRNWISRNDEDKGEKGSSELWGPTGLTSSPEAVEPKGTKGDKEERKHIWANFLAFAGLRVK